MADFKKMYLTLFNAITDALAFLNRGDVLAAKQILITAQQETEEMYINESQG